LDIAASPSRCASRMGWSADQTECASNPCFAGISLSSLAQIPGFSSVMSCKDSSIMPELASYRWRTKLQTRNSWKLCGWHFQSVIPLKIEWIFYLYDQMVKIDVMINGVFVVKLKMLPSSEYYHMSIGLKNVT